MPDTIRFLKLTPDGTLTEGQAPRTGHGLLDAMYEAIGCSHVEAVRLGLDDGYEDHGCVASMYVDGDGLLADEPEVNPFAGFVVKELNSRVYQHYVGTALFFGPVDSDGDDTSLPDDVCERIGTVVQRVAVWRAK